MKRVRIYFYILFLISLISFFVMIFSHNMRFEIMISVAVITAWIVCLIHMELSFFAPADKARNMQDEKSLEKLIGEEIWAGKEGYIEVLSERIGNYIQDEISGLNLEMLRRKSEFTALQNQINPHFLYNTLETIRSQAITDGDKEIAEMVERLSSIFRYSISRKGELVPLRDELNNIRNYMTIMEFRFYDRFTLEIDIDEEEGRVYDFYIPRLILQPIVENAINHGLGATVKGGIVGIEVALADDLIITVSDNGKGMSLRELDDLNQKIHSTDFFGKVKEDPGKKSTGIALVNVNKRIQLLYGKKYGLNVYSSENCGTDVEIILPIIDNMENLTVGKDIAEGE